MFHQPSNRTPRGSPAYLPQYSIGSYSGNEGEMNALNVISSPPPDSILPDVGPHYSHSDAAIITTSLSSGYPPPPPHHLIHSSSFPPSAYMNNPPQPWNLYPNQQQQQQQPATSSSPKPQPARLQQQSRSESTQQQPPTILVRGWQNSTPDSLPPKEQQEAIPTTNFFQASPIQVHTISLSHASSCFPSSRKHMEQSGKVPKL